MKRNKVDTLKKIKIGDEFKVEFLPNRKGNKPICIIKGMVAFIDYRDKQIITSGSVWYVSIVNLFGNHLTVKPLVMVKSKEANEAELKERLSKIKNGGGKVSFENLKDVLS